MRPLLRAGGTVRLPPALFGTHTDGTSGGGGSSGGGKSGGPVALVTGLTELWRPAKYGRKNRCVQLCCDLVVEHCDRFGAPDFPVMLASAFIVCICCRSSLGDC